VTVSDTEHWTTPSGHDLRMICGVLGKDLKGRPVMGYSYALVVSHIGGECDWIVLSEAEFDALKAVSRAV
jgi:hypothetical protein